MRAAINKKSTTTEPSPYNGHQPKPPGGGGGGGWCLNASILSRLMLNTKESGFGSLLIYGLHCMSAPGEMKIWCVRLDEKSTFMELKSALAHSHMKLPVILVKLK